MNQMRKELQNPSEFQPNEKFLQKTKYAAVICNQIYDQKVITLKDLPAVVDDYKNAMHTIKMMGILPENTFEIRNASYGEVEELYAWLRDRIAVQAKILVNKTGIIGQKGLI